MTRSLQAASFGLAVSLLVPYCASAQGLGDAAAQEKERRKGKATKSYGDEDLGRTKAPAQSFETGSADDPNAAAIAPADAAAGSKGEAQTGKEKSDVDQRAAQEKDWHERMKKAQDDLLALNTEAFKLQTSLNDMTGNYYSASRTSMMSRMQDLQKQIATSQGTIDTLQEEGRRNGFR